MRLRDHKFLGMTQSLCPDCLAVVQAKIIVRNNRVYFRKHCRDHGVREDFVCSDASRFDRLEHTTPGKLPEVFGTDVRHGCPLDCGLCEEHEQHTCIALLEITSSCNLTCPICFAASAPGGDHLTLEQCRAAIDRLVRVEGRPEVLQLSGGEPTIHPRFLDVLRYATGQPIDVVMINTNGVRFAKDDAFLESVAEYRDRVEVYFQLDGLREGIHDRLRGRSLLDEKLTAIERLGESGLKTTLVCTLQAGVNEDQIGDIVRFGLSRPHVTGISFQPAMYSGRYFLPSDLEDRITFPDVVDAVADQVPGVFTADDFVPLPCAHPNGHVLTYAYRDGESTVPLSRFINLDRNMDLLANGIVFTRDRAKSLIESVLGDCGCGDGGCGVDFGDHGRLEDSRPSVDDPTIAAAAEGFLQKALTRQLSQSDLIRITVTSFMDAYNFDTRQVMKSCVHHLLPSGHLIPFSAYNVLYRDGHVALPELRQDDAITKPTRLPVLSR